MLDGLRRPALRNAQVSFALAYASEWAFATALAVVAFDAGGVSAVGVIGLLRMVAAALLTPLTAAAADRVRRERILIVVSTLRALALGAAALVLARDGGLWLVYGLSIGATIAFTLFRPAHSALLPSLCEAPRDLVGANLVRTVSDAGMIIVGPLVAAGLLALDGPSAAFAAAGVMSLAAALFAGLVRYEAPPRVAPAARVAPLAEARAGLSAICRTPDARLIVTLAMAQTFTRGALQVFTVVVALELLHGGDALVGVLTAAVGIGGVGGALVAPSLMCGRRLASHFGIGIALWGAPLALLAGVHATALAIALLAFVGVGKLLVDVGMFTLLARLTPDEVLARVFGVLEALIALSVGLGAIAVPVLVHALGTRPALVVVGTIGPVFAAVTWSRLRVLDGKMSARDGQISLLRGAPMLRPLPVASLEYLARHLQGASVAAGDTVFRQGDRGDRFYLIARGEADVLGDERFIRRLVAGESFGEIAVLEDLPRTTTVVARTDLELYAIPRAEFVHAVGGFTQSASEAALVVADRLAAFAPRAATI